MSVFKIAFIGSEQDRSICDFTKQNLKCSENDTVELVDITDKDPQEILTQGSIQAVLYYNDIYNSREYSQKLQRVLTSQKERKDITIFSLAREKMTSVSTLAERETLAQMYLDKFEDITTDDVVVYTASGQTEQDLSNYVNGVMQVSVKEYFAEARDVEKTVEQKIDKLLEMIEQATASKHAYTAGHVQRVAEYTDALAEQLGFTEQERSEVVLSAKLHDIGKLLTPQSVLGKKSTLNMDERDNMGLHTEGGEGFLLSLIEQHPQYADKINEEVLKGVANHHKDWDGMHGKKQGEEPDPFHGDIVGKYALTIAVADCIDAMTSQRAYNNPKHILDLLRDLYKNRGKQFKPEIAEAAIVMLSKEFANLGLDPLKIVPEEPAEEYNKMPDIGLKNFLESHAEEFEVNRNAKPEDYSRLGFRIDENGYLDLKGIYVTPRNPEIRFNDEFQFQVTKYKYVHGKTVQEVLDMPEVVEQLKEQVDKKFEMQDREGAQAVARAREVSREEKTNNFADQILDMTVNDNTVNIDSFNALTHLIKEEINPERNIIKQEEEKNSGLMK